jgi:hypothetical protein
MSEKYKIEYENEDFLIVLHTRDIITPKIAKKLYNKMTQNEGQMVYPSIRGIESVIFISPYKTAFKLAKIYWNKKEVKDISNKIIDVLNLSDVDIDWADESFKMKSNKD